MKLLIVEDEERLADSLAEGFRLKGYAVDVLYDGTAARGRLRTAADEYDLLILDLMLPGVPGDELCAELRASGSSLPVLVLTARAEIGSKVDLLHTGADDYLVKPFSFAELAARVQAILRRPVQLSHEVLAVGDLRIDTRDRAVTARGKPVPLTQKEFALIAYLARHAGRTVSRDELVSHVWEYDHESASNSLDVHIKNIRHKITAHHVAHGIETVRGVGFRLAV